MYLISADWLSLPLGKGGMKSVLVLVDYFSHHVWAYKFKGEGTGKKTVNALQTVFGTFGYPAILMSDGGRHLDCEEVNSFCRERGTRCHITPAYVPKTNGLVENTNCLLVRALVRATVGGLDEGHHINEWPELLGDILAAINSHLVSTTGQ